MTEKQIDFAADVPTVAGDHLSALTSLGQRALSLRDEIDALEETLKARKATLRAVEEEQIPAIVDAAGVAQYRFMNGIVITVGQEFTASIPKDRAAEQAAWLREQGHDALIATEVKAKFAKGADVEAQQALALLTEQGITASLDTSLHTGQIKALAKELMGAGKTFPLELFGVYVVRKAVLTLKKGK